MDPETGKEIAETVRAFKSDPGSYKVPEDYREKLMDAERELYRGSGSKVQMIRRIWYSAAAIVVTALTIYVLVFQPFRKKSAGELYAEYSRTLVQTEQITEIA